MNRIKEKSYPGVFYRMAKRIGGKGTEKVYYVVWKDSAGKVQEEKVGRQYADKMTPAQAATRRGELIEGKRPTRKQTREEKEAAKREAESKWTIDKMWTEYRQGRTNTASLNTDTYRYKKHVEPTFGNKEPNEILQLDVDRLRIRLLKTLSPQTVKHVLTLIDRIVNYGVRKQLCEPLKFKIEKPRVNNLKTEDLSADQLKKLVEFLDTYPDVQIANLIRMALFTGMRRGELFKLQWQDVDFERGFIHLKDPKGGPDQVIPMNESARSVLGSHPKAAHSTYVFPGRRGKHRNNANKTLRTIKEKVGLPKSFRMMHGLRHVYASILASSGKVDMYVLQKLLTHKSPTMTQRYAHLRDETLRNAANVAGNIFDNIGKQKEKVVNLDDHEAE